MLNDDDVDTEISSIRGHSEKINKDKSMYSERLLIMEQFKNEDDSDASDQFGES